MVETMTIEWNTILLPVGALLYIYMMYRVERKFSQKNRSTDSEFLAYIARSRECSEYDLFGEAAREWNVGGGNIDEDFKEYLKEGDMPYYVRDFVRKARPSGAQARHEEEKSSDSASA